MIRPAGQLRAVVCLVVLAVVFWAAPSQGVVELAGVPLDGFLDVSSDHWAYGEITACLAAGIVMGYEDGTYHPEGSVSRAQMAAYISRALAGDDASVPAGPATASFPDVATGHWAYKYVEYCQAQAIAGGYQDGTYQPDAVVTRDQMAVYVQRAFELPIPEAPPAPDFTLQTLDGTQQYRLSDLTGRPVAVLFWTSWCSYCAPQAVDLETLYQRYQDQSFLVLGVGLDDPAALQDKAEALGLTFPVGYNPDAGELYGVEAIPYTFIIDRSGSISSSWLGLQPIDTLEAAIQEVL
jgi:peroxiredoxin